MEIFWGSGNGPGWRVLLAARFKNIPYESRLLSFSKAEHKTPEMLAMNPRGKLPVLRDGSFTLYESIAMLAYLDEKFPEPTIFGKTPEEKATTWRKVMEIESYVMPAFNVVLRPILFSQLEEKAAELQAGKPAMHAELAKLEAQVSSSHYLGGDKFSAADFVAFPVLMTLLRAARKPDARALDLGLLPFETQYPGLAAWIKKVEAIPGYEETYPPHWREG